MLTLFLIRLRFFLRSVLNPSADEATGFFSTGRSIFLRILGPSSLVYCVFRKLSSSFFSSVSGFVSTTGVSTTGASSSSFFFLVVFFALGFSSSSSFFFLSDFDLGRESRSVLPFTLTSIFWSVFALITSSSFAFFFTLSFGACRSLIRISSGSSTLVFFTGSVVTVSSIPSRFIFAFEMEVATSLSFFSSENWLRRRPYCSGESLRLGLASILCPFVLRKSPIAFIPVLLSLATLLNFFTSSAMLCFKVNR